MLERTRMHLHPLCLSAHTALFDGLEIIGRYLGELDKRMRETALECAEIRNRNRDDERVDG